MKSPTVVAWSLLGSAQAGFFGLFAEQQQFPPGRNQTVSLNTTTTTASTTMLSTVTVVTTSVAYVLPSPPSMAPSPTSQTSLLAGPTLACSYDSAPSMLMPFSIFNASSPFSANYSAVFNLTNSTNPDFCGAVRFCRSRPPGLYCYSTADWCKRNETEPCLPVAMVACPQGLFVSCSEGYACQDEDGPWWDEDRFYSPVRGSILQDQFFNQASPQFNQSQPFNQTQQQPKPHIASCRAIIEPTSTATSGLQQSVVYLYATGQQQRQEKGQVDICAPASTSSSICVTPTAKSFMPSSSTCPPSVSTVWWWPTITYSPSMQAQPTGVEKGQLPCPEVKRYLSPPKTCNGPYPQVPTSTLTLLYMSSYCPSTATVTSEATSVTTQTVSQMVTQTSTVTAEAPLASTVTISAPAAVTVTETSLVTPLPAASPIPAVTAAKAPAIPQAAPSTPQAPPVAAGAKIPPESFPKAGEPYAVYSAKAAAIATVVQA